MKLCLKLNNYKKHLQKLLSIKRRRTILLGIIVIGRSWNGDKSVKSEKMTPTTFVVPHTTLVFLYNASVACGLPKKNNSINTPSSHSPLETSLFHQFLYDIVIRILMASASFVKLNASSSPWIGQLSFNQRTGSSARLPATRVSVIRAGSYSEELVKTAVSLSFHFCFILDWSCGFCFWIYKVDLILRCEWTIWLIELRFFCCC